MLLKIFQAVYLKELTICQQMKQHLIVYNNALVESEFKHKITF